MLLPKRPHQVRPQPQHSAEEAVYGCHVQGPQRSHKRKDPNIVYSIQYMVNSIWYRVYDIWYTVHGMQTE